MKTIRKFFVIDLKFSDYFTIRNQSHASVTATQRGQVTIITVIGEEAGFREVESALEGYEYTVV